MSRMISCTAIALLGLFFACFAQAEKVIDGVHVADSEEVSGARLMLNGAAANRRNGSTINVTALYLQTPCRTLDCINRIEGAKRIKIHYLVDVDGSLMSRYFMNEFKAVATPDEFRSLINEIVKMGWTSNDVKKLRKGDVVTIDWLPGRGVRSSINGNPVTIDGDTEYVKSDLMYRVMLRMNVGEHRPAEYRQGILGG